MICLSINTPEFNCFSTVNKVSEDWKQQFRGVDFVLCYRKLSVLEIV